MFKKNNKLKRNFLLLSGLALVIFTLGILFTNASDPFSDGSSILKITLIPADLVPAGADFLGVGASSNAFQSGNWVYKVQNDRSPLLTYEMMIIHNAAASKNTLIPPYDRVGPYTLRQPFADGDTFEKLSGPAQNNARIQVNNFAIELGKTTGQILSTGPKPAERPYLLPSGDYAQIDYPNGNGSNFRFNPDGTIKQAFDPFGILSAEQGQSWFEGEKVTPVRKSFATDLPIDAGDPRLTRLSSTYPGAAGLSTLRSITIVPSALAIGGILVLANELKKDIGAASTPELKNAAHNRAVRKIGEFIGYGALGAGGLLAISAVNPLLGAIATYWLAGEGFVALGAYISAEFSNEDLVGWNLVNSTRFSLDDSNPNMAKLRAYQRDNLQQVIKRADENNGTSNTYLRTLAAVAIKSDPSYTEYFYSPSRTDKNNLRSGFFRSQGEVRNSQIFAELVNLDVQSKKWKNGSKSDKDSATIGFTTLWFLKSDLAAIQKVTGRAYNYPQKLENKVYATAKAANIQIPQLTQTPISPVAASPKSGVDGARINGSFSSVDLTPYYVAPNTPVESTPRKVLGDGLTRGYVTVIVQSSDMSAENIAYLEGGGSRYTYMKNGVIVDINPDTGVATQLPVSEPAGREGGVYSIETLYPDP